MTLRKASEADGDELEVEDTARGRIRYLRLLLGVPGYHQKRQALFEYEEKFERISRRWRLIGYQYELRFEPAGSGRWAEHWHDEEFHRHWGSPSRHGGAHHPSRPIQLFDARAEMLRRFALGPKGLDPGDED
ncbi:MAG: hypothetical protein HYX56_07330 [Chloroflexi bacterium]|nr:hypothetical protein [Chloroflexota bacterium]